MTPKQKVAGYWTVDLLNGKAYHGAWEGKGSSRCAKVATHVIMTKEPGISGKNPSRLKAGIEYSPRCGPNVHRMAPGHHFQMSSCLWSTTICIAGRQPALVATIAPDAN